MSFARRKFIFSSFFSTLAAQAQTSALPACLVDVTHIGSESHDSPFFEHYHVLALPLASLLVQPAQGIVVKTSPVDQGSYDAAAFEAFIAASGLDKRQLQHHQHDVAITKNQLERIAAGEKDVELRVISPNGNYIHNFLVTAPPSVLVKVRKARRRA
jgi:hypothetical protein